MSDQELLALLTDEPEKAYPLLLKQYANLVFAIALNKLKGVCSREDIEECVSDVFIKFYEQVDRFDPKRGSLKAYLSVIAKHCAIDRFRRQLSVSPTLPFDEENGALQIPCSRAKADEALCQREAQEALWRAIQRLKAKDAQIIVRRYFYEESTGAIAAKMGLSPAAVQKRAERAVIKLRKIMEDMGYEP